ncbi:MAG: hypothetical protein ABI895_05010 [Deltaproteobacteria bacterium]
MSEVATPADVRAVRRALGLVLAGLAVQLGCAFFWSPATFLLAALLGTPLVAAGAFWGWLSRARSVRRRMGGN